MSEDIKVEAVTPANPANPVAPVTPVTPEPAKPFNFVVSFEKAITVFVNVIAFIQTYVEPALQALVNQYKMSGSPEGVNTGEDYKKIVSSATINTALLTPALAIVLQVLGIVATLPQVASSAVAVFVINLAIQLLTHYVNGPPADPANPVTPVPKA